ncbi:MAG: hypothetical protein EBR82_38910 [Caulobacteraceae bacterium]|nr:hypothetical protein [Caulobacteraceae bacterium]
MDEFGDIVDSIYKTYFKKFWGHDDFDEVKSSKITVKQNMDMYDFLTDRGYKYDLLHRVYTDPTGNPVLNPQFVYLTLKNKETVPWQKKN